MVVVFSKISMGFIFFYISNKLFLSNVSVDIEGQFKKPTCYYSLLFYLKNHFGSKTVTVHKTVQITL